MTRAIARAALAAVALGLALGNYWFTFGLWPRSWAAFAFFALAGMAVHAGLDLIRQDEQNKS